VKLKRAALTAGCLALALGGCERATTGQRIPIYDRPQVALLLVDLQKEFLAPGGRQPVAPSQVAAMLAATNRLVESARSLGVELVYVRSDASAGGELDSRLQHPSGPVFRKGRAATRAASTHSRRCRGKVWSSSTASGCSPNGCAGRSTWGHASASPKAVRVASSWKRRIGSTSPCTRSAPTLEAYAQVAKRDDVAS
jgi:Isochorismatase family